MSANTNVQDSFEEVTSKSTEPISFYNDAALREPDEWRLVDPGFEMYISH